MESRKEELLRQAREFEESRRRVAAQKPYDPKSMRMRMPAGCALVIALAGIGVAYALFRLFAF